MVLLVSNCSSIMFVASSETIIWLSPLSVVGIIGTTRLIESSFLIVGIY